MSQNGQVTRRRPTTGTTSATKGPRQLTGRRVRRVRADQTQRIVSCAIVVATALGMLLCGVAIALDRSLVELSGAYGALAVLVATIVRARSTNTGGKRV